MPEELHSENAQAVTLSHYLAVLRRRKWIILTAMVIVPLAAGYAYALEKEDAVLSESER